MPKAKLMAEGRAREHARLEKTGYALNKQLYMESFPAQRAAEVAASHFCRKT